MKNDIRHYINIVNEAAMLQNPSMGEEQGMQWERQLMDTWAPKAARYMAKVVKNLFSTLYPDVKIRVWDRDGLVTATTDSYYRNPEDVKADVFGQRNNPNWECNFFVGPLFLREDGRAYLDLMVEDAASGQYPGVWKLLAKEWAQWANSQLKQTGAEEACFSVNEDRSDAWQRIAANAGLKFIVHN